MISIVVADVICALANEFRAVCYSINYLQLTMSHRSTDNQPQFWHTPITRLHTFTFVSKMELCLINRFLNLCNIPKFPLTHWRTKVQHKTPFPPRKFNVLPIYLLQTKRISTRKDEEEAKKNFENSKRLYCERTEEMEQTHIF